MNRIGQFFLVLFLAGIVLLLNTQFATAASISIVPTPAQNGDFTVEVHSRNGDPTLGDGSNEDTSWEFDLQGICFTGELTDATLILKGKRKDENGNLTMDLTIESFINPNNIDTLNDINENLHIKEIQTEEVPRTMTKLINPDNPVYGKSVDTDGNMENDAIMFDLLHPYSSTQILGAIDSNGGKLHFEYFDDALITSAELELKFTTQ